ncbi:helical backbone metal receptor [Nocardioides sp. AE5]|uniref:helical backbone metal receptor n=1 Tax=Nocardioides sp. AE5 TaxID=2962573 RepID=UPI0028824D84|nr:helical backbone metal receptor [Nocardioides sp. AE5]MDT0201578.1 helical backbone metal receptor [Nocardioides sp. AE5]
MNDARLLDDLGTAVELAGPPQRIVSLVPSLTEALAPTGRLVGATDWCTHPAGLAVDRVRGTKNPDLAAIAGLQPDLVIANQEENRELDVRRLREQGVAVWVTVTESVPESIASMRRLFVEVLGEPEPDWLTEADRLWSGDRPPVRRTAAVPIWRDPWMVVGRDTFTGDLLRRLGIDNVYADAKGRYPHTTVAEIVAREPDLVLLPDEPYEFTADDGPEAFEDLATVLLEGRLITWYGPALVEAHVTLQELLGRPTI